ncbi:MAG: PfkB family carbohydrate kinase [Chloroflexota bacterium]|nr:PfkB family carbohydrate kinase [Chloroflexota bacterium]
MIQASPYDVVVLGDYFYDLIFSGLQAFPVLGQEKLSHELVTTGGGSYITVCALHRLGVRVGWRAHFGNDEYSRQIYQLAAGAGIDLQLARVADTPYRRVTTALPMQGERAFVTYADPPPPDRHEFWRIALETTRYRHLHLPGAIAPDRLAPLVSAARAAGASISMDCQDVALLYKECEWQKLVGMVDVFMPNAREARLIAKTDDLDAAMRLLLDWGQVIVIKDGGSGALVGKGSGAYTRVPSITAGDCVDTTGAGDCFNAGFLYGYVCEGASVEQCTRYGNICGGLSVTGEGGATHAPDLASLRAWVEKL